MTKVYKLLNELEDDFLLIGLSANSRDYKLAWELNLVFGWDLRQENDIIISLKKTRKNSASAPSLFSETEDDTNAENQSLHSVYSFNDEAGGLSMRLLNNPGSAGLLLPELPNLNYFLQIHGPMLNNEEDFFVEKSMELSTVSTAYIIDLADLKNKDRLFL